MGLLNALSDAVMSSFADQWKEIVVPGEFNEHTLVSPGVLKTRNNGRGNNSPGSDGIISNGSKIFVPENTAAFVFNQSAIENIVLLSGGYEYLDGDPSVFNGDGLISPIVNQVKKRFGYGGITAEKKQIAFVNLREIRDIRYGMLGPQVFHDPDYGVDLEIHVYGSFSIRITDAECFIRDFVPPGMISYSIDEPSANSLLVGEFLQSLMVALNSLSARVPVSQLLSKSNEISEMIAHDDVNAGTWKRRFGLELVKATIKNIELSDTSKEIIRHYAAKKTDMTAYDNVSKKAADISAQQAIARGIQDNGLGNIGGMLFGMNLVNGLGTNAALKTESLNQQLDLLKKLKEALDEGILTQEEYDLKKKDILG